MAFDVLVCVFMHVFDVLSDSDTHLLLLLLLSSAGFSYRRMCGTYETDSGANSGETNTDPATSGTFLLTATVLLRKSHVNIST